MPERDNGKNEKERGQSSVLVWIIVGAALLGFFAIGQYIGSLFGV